MIDPRGWARWVRLTVPTGLLLAVAAVLLAAPSASAHATLLGTDPANDAVLPEAPAAVTLTFDEPVTVWKTSVTVFDPEGERLDVDVQAVDSEVVAELPDSLGRGSYTVNFRVISADDHPVSGGFTFSVGERTTPVGSVETAEPTTSLNVARLAADSVGYLGLLGALGIAFFELLILDATPGAMPRLRRALRRVSWSLAAFALVGITTALPLTVAWQQAGSLGDIAATSSWSESLSSHAGTSALLAAVGLVAVLLATPYAAKTAIRANPASIAAAIGAVVALGSLPWVGHTRTYGPQWLVVAADLVHVLAAASWIGCIIGLVLTLSRWSDASTTRSARTVARFSAMAGWTVTALTLAGVTMAWRILGSLDALWETSYGKALIVKLCIVAVVLALAGWNRLALLPRVEADGNDRSARRLLTRSLQLEAVSLVAVLVATSVLVTQSPGDTGSSLEAGTTERARGIETELGDGAGLVRLRMSPLVAGRNVVQVYLRDREGEPLRVLGAPSVRFRLDSEQLGPLPAEMTRVGPGQFEGTVDLAVAGDWDVAISARTSKYESPVASMTFTVS